MTLEGLKTMLESISGFADKVVYYAWPVGEAPELPFICYLETASNNFGADGVVYDYIRQIDIELYSETRDLISESLIEATLHNSGIYWQKSIDYIDSEKMFMTTYSIEV